MDDNAAPLVVTTDELLLDEVLRLCAAVGVTPVVAADVAAARRGWLDASVVVVGADLAGPLAGSSPRRRDDVLIAGTALMADVWPAAVAVGAQHVLTLPADQGELIDVLAAALDGAGDACLVAVVGGAGGAGASTFAGALALTAAGRGLRSLLIDGDRLGGGIDVLMGSESVDGLRWPDVANTKGRIRGDSLRRALPMHDALSTLSWDRGDQGAFDRDAVCAVLSASRRSFDTIVADVPRALDAAISEVVGRSVLTILVVPEDLRALGAAMCTVAPLKELAAEVALVTRHGGRKIGAELMAERLGLPLLARIRNDRQLPVAVEAGFGPLGGRTRALRRGCGSVLDALGLEAV